MTMIPRFFLLSLALSLAGNTFAAEDVYVPDDLKPWQDWVLQGKEYRNCPFFFSSGAESEDHFICAWPDRLGLAVDAEGGRFNQDWTVYAAEEWVPLPGDAAHWPQQVSVNGRVIEVIARDAVPSIRLAPGTWTVGGRFEWDERPRTLRVPRESGLIDLSIDDETIVRPQRNGRDLWLGEREQERKEKDALQVQAYRLIADDVPLRLGTVFFVEASGSVREELIAPALPDGFVPLSIDSELPSRLEPDGSLRLQVRPGSWEVRLLARADSSVDDAVTLPAADSNMPATEIWSFRSNDELRVTVPEGLAPIDPLQVDVPEDWIELPGFRIQSGETLSIAERSRGKVATDNQLSLAREMWLDFDGGGFVFNDIIRGNMRDGWRLDMSEPYGLFRAAEDGENLLVTVGGEAGRAGIEVRQPDVSIEALGRTETRGQMPVTGWQARFNRADAMLHLPPGNNLFAALGADRSSTSWVNQWQLLDFFLVLITSIAAARLFGRETGVLALVALTLSLHEPGAPGFIWLNLLVAVALVRVAPAGRLLQASKTYRNLSFVALLFIFVPFAADQLRVAIYPQLESQSSAGFYERFQRSRMANLYGAGDLAFQMAPVPESPPARPDVIEEIVVTGSKISRSFERYAPNAIVQVGPGRPAWQWNSYRLSWSGPVEADRSMRLLIMPRWLMTVLRIIEVLLLGALIATIVLDVLNRRPPWLRGNGRPNADGSASVVGAAAFLVAALLLGSSPPALADTPSDAVLKQLEERLLAPPACVPRCAEIVDARVEVGSETMTMRLTANTLEDVALSLPGSMASWRPETVLIDNAPAKQIYRSNDDTLWLRTPVGRHEVTLRGPLPPVDSLEIPFPTRPRVIAVETSDWFVAGVQDRRLLSGSLQLTRLQQQTDGQTAARWESSRFPVFARVERDIDLDLDWRVRTTVYRVAPEQGAITLNVPLLGGESVVTEDITVSDGVVLVSMNPAESSVTWDSNLQRESPIELQAPDDSPWKESWSFAIGSVWHADFDGVPESESDDAEVSYRVARFFPRPGETLTTDVDRPAATSGDTLVFEQVSLMTDVGERSRNSTLMLRYRSTRGTQHNIQLPPDAEITSVSIDRVTAPLRAENGTLRLPILPGEHGVSIAWRSDEPVGFRTAVPEVELGAGASNLHSSLTLPDNRWVVATFGPKLGPSVLYWSELLVLILLAFVLGRTKLTPLASRDWLLLGLGFSTFSWIALAFIVAWLLIVDVQRDWKRKLSRWRYNGVQIIIALLSLTALVTIVTSLPMGLLGNPDMHVIGNDSYGNSLSWFDDRTTSAMPAAFVLSLPMWIYKVLILAWSLWLSFALLKWLPWVWRQFMAEDLWKSGGKIKKPATDTP